MAAPLTESLDAYKLRIAAETVWGEARGEDYLGKLAVAWVIRNRVQQPAWWGRDIASVCMKPYQFSCRNPNDPNARLLKQVPDEDPVLTECRRACEAAFNGVEDDPTGGATHYKVTGTPAQWDKATEGKDVVEIGHHSFFNIGPHG